MMSNFFGHFWPTLKYLINVLHKLLIFWQFSTCAVLLHPACSLIFWNFTIFIRFCRVPTYPKSDFPPDLKPFLLVKTGILKIPCRMRNGVNGWIQFFRNKTYLAKNQISYVDGPLYKNFVFEKYLLFQKKTLLACTLLTKSSDGGPPPSGFG